MVQRAVFDLNSCKKFTLLLPPSFNNYNGLKRANINQPKMMTNLSYFMSRSRNTKTCCIALKMLAAYS